MRRIASTAKPATSRTRPRTSTGSCRKAEEVPITRTCRLAILGFAALSAAGAAPARVEPRAALHAFVEARAAASAGALDQASARYVAALAAAPGNRLVASQALAHGAAAGDWRLALEAAHVLERADAVTPDARLLLVAESFRARDWRSASARIDAVERDRIFAFAAPILRAWVALGSRQGDPLGLLPAEGGNGMAAAYADEQRPLIMLALGRPGAGAALTRAANSAGARNARLRIAGAALLARRGDRAGALALLEGNASALLAARALVEAHRPLAGAIDTPEAALAELMVRLALDLNAQQANALAMPIARVSTWLAPDNSETWMVAAALLAAQGKPRLAAPLLAYVRADDPFAAAALDQRVEVALDAGDRDAALAEALAATRSAGARSADWVRAGDVYGQLHRPADAAAAFTRALALRRDDDESRPEWTLQLMRGGAFDEAGNWPEARAALREAYRLAPGEPLVLNYLGYAELVRHENMDEAERLVREAHRQAPDNNAITDSLGWALYQRGRLAEAIVLLEQSAQGEPSDVEINEHLGDAYYAAGRRLEARFAWRAASVYAEGEAAARLAAKIDTGLTPQLAAR